MQRESLRGRTLWRPGRWRGPARVSVSEACSSPRGRQPRRARRRKQKNPSAGVLSARGRDYAGGRYSHRSAPRNVLCCRGGPLRPRLAQCQLRPNCGSRATDAGRFESRFFRHAAALAGRPRRLSAWVLSCFCFRRPCAVPDPSSGVTQAPNVIAVCGSYLIEWHPALSDQLTGVSSCRSTGQNFLCKRSGS